MLHWLLAADGITVLAMTLVLAGAACVLAPSRALAPFVLTALLAWAVATPFAAASAITLRGGIAVALWTLAVVAVPAAIFGILVARGTARRHLVLVGAFLLAMMPPAAFVAQALLECHVGHYCPGL